MRIFFWVLIALAIFINCETLKDGHNWGDDFAQYIINARNIIEGKPYISGIMLENSVVYPPGLPLLLAPVLKIFGLNFKILKSLNIIFWYLSIFLLYALFLRIEGRRFALMAAVFLAMSSYFFIYKQNVLSDIPFFLFVSSSLYMFERWSDNNTGRQGRLFFIGFLFSVSIALWLRSAGVTLFVAAFFYFILIKPDKKALVSTLAVFVVNEFSLFLWMGLHPGFWSTVGQTPQVFFASIFHNFATVFRSLWFFFCPSQTVFSSKLFNMIDPVVLLAAPILYLIMVGVFIYGLQKKNLSYLECFSFFYISLLIFWSGFTMSPDGFTRFVLPLLPFAFVGSLRLLHVLKRFKIDCYGWGRIIFSVLLLLNLTNVIINWGYNDDVINLTENSELIAWAKQNMNSDEHFMFWKPRALALLTRRVGTAPWIFPDQQQNFLQRVKDFKITYVFSMKINDQNDQNLITQMEQSKLFRLAWENGMYKVFKFIN